MNFSKKNLNLVNVNSLFSGKKLVLLAFVIIFTSMSSCSDDDAVEIQKTGLTQQEEDDLKFSREEEKLARDVYLFSYDKYGEVVFNSIAGSEQQHMDQVLVLLNTYQLIDPASAERGVFSNQVLQTLYNDLTTQSDISLLEAYKVGAIIEDLDINDLDDLESRTTNADLLNIYSKLKCGSRNHLRSYIELLVSNGFNYVPQYISLDKFTAIINGTNEQCGR